LLESFRLFYTRISSTFTTQSRDSLFCFLSFPFVD
jgi:hypothetical protein